MKAPKLETERTNALCGVWRKLGCEVLNLTIGAQNASGWPDVCLTHPTHAPFYTGWIEFKNPQTRIRDRQKVVIESLRKGGQNVELVRFVEWSYQGKINKEHYFRFAFMRETIEEGILGTYLLQGSLNQIARDFLCVLKSERDLGQ